VTYTYVTCPDCDRRLGEQTYGYACPCGARWTPDGKRLAWPVYRWARRRAQHLAQLCVLLALMLALAVFATVCLVEGEL
jgi:hypothetical protein